MSQQNSSATKSSSSTTSSSSTSFIEATTSSSTNSTTETTFSSRESTSASSSSTSQIPHQQRFVQAVSFQNNRELIQSLSQARKGPKVVFQEEICLNGELIQVMLELNPKKVVLQNCTFDPNNSMCFDYSLKFLSLGNSMKPFFRFAVQLNDHTAQWIICDKLPNLEFIDHVHINSLLFILSNDVSQKPSLNDISSLIFLPSTSDFGKPISSQSKENLKSMMDPLYPKVKHLMLMHIDLDGDIGEYIPILSSKSDLIYIWNCGFQTDDLIWSSLSHSLRLINSMCTVKVQSVQYAIPINGHTTQIVLNKSSSFVMPNSSDLVHGLVFSLEQSPPKDLSSNNISYLALLPSITDFMEPLTLQFRQNLKSLMDRQFPKLKHLLLVGINFGSPIGDFISISQLKLDLIYIWKCVFEMNDTIWTLLIGSMERIKSMLTKKVMCFQFTISINGHITQVVLNFTPSLVIPNSPDLIHGLILPFGENFPKDELLKNVSFLIFLPSEADSSKSSSFQSMQSLESFKSSQCPKLVDLFLSGISIDDVKEKYGSISELRLMVHFL
jgi:hypothetical protein